MTTLPALSDAPAQLATGTADNGAPWFKVTVSADAKTASVDMDGIPTVALKNATGMANPLAAMDLVRAVNALAVIPVGDDAATLTTRMDVLTTNNLLALHSMCPKTALEGMLAAQTLGLHQLAMGALHRAAHATHPENRDREARQAAKLTGAFAAHAQALQRLQGGGTVQRVVVERVTVEAGGQAVVGALSGRVGT